MILYVLNHTFRFETENLCRVFFPDEKLTVLYADSGEVDDFKVYTAFDGVRMTSKTVSAGKNGFEFSETPLSSGGDDMEYSAALALFKTLSASTGYIPEWGMLTGVRPSKLFHTLSEELGESGAYDYFTRKLLVSPEKTKLASSVENAQKSIIAGNRPEDFSLYVAIPFCPSRCGYCSFVSHSITSAGAKKLLEPYVDCLCRELEATAEIARGLHLNLKSVYFGGGTPTVLSETLLAKLLNKVNEVFDLSACAEFTVEAGRPDTVTPEKLQTLKKAGVERISINPQSFDDSVLREVRRMHTAADTVAAFELARSVGFDCINMDLIAGLPGDTAEGFSASVDKAVGLGAENITVHTLAMKRSSELTQSGARVGRGEAAGRMLSYAAKKLSGSGYFPYYMYRQSRCVGNYENVGWCKSGRESLYNIVMMEEIHTVLAAGAGAVTKLRQFNGNYIERIFNFKYPYEYIERFGEMLSRKDGISKFYSTYN